MGMFGSRAGAVAIMGRRRKSGAGAALEPGPIMASGGTIITQSWGGLNYAIHTFTATGTSSLNIVRSASWDDGNLVRHLIVAGGGPGGANVPTSEGMAGGGGGQVTMGWSRIFTQQTYNVVVGNGGTFSTGSGPTNGEKSSVFGTSSNGGGYGAWSGDTTGFDGGTGGGGGYTTGGAGSGFSGGNGDFGYWLGGAGVWAAWTVDTASRRYAGGGGGSAGSLNGPSSHANMDALYTDGSDAIQGGHGGPGRPSAIYSTSSYDYKYYGGGGGGGYGYDNSTPSFTSLGDGNYSQGLTKGGGSNAKTSGDATGSVNTGGGGGAIFDPTSQTSAGGSGIVVISYPLDNITSSYLQSYLNISSSLISKDNLSQTFLTGGFQVTVMVPSGAGPLGGYVGNIYYFDEYHYLSIGGLEPAKVTLAANFYVLPLNLDGEIIGGETITIDVDWGGGNLRVSGDLNGNDTIPSSLGNWGTIAVSTDMRVGGGGFNPFFPTPAVSGRIWNALTSAYA